jgi:hypothetical protein
MMDLTCMNLGEKMEAVSQIKAERETPIIGVIGASVPDSLYDELDGMGLGYKLRMHLKDQRGTIFTGGVGGVGVDTYKGVVLGTKDLRRESGNEVPDKFFLLVPETVEVGRKIIPYCPPAEYKALAKSLGKKIDMVVAGYSMGERRMYVAEVADVLIMANGGLGTLDEALLGVKNGRPVIPITSTSGAAMYLNYLVKSKSGDRLLERLAERGIDINPRKMNLDLVRPADDVEEAIEILRTVTPD